MAEDLHGFITGQLWLKLKADVAEFRVFTPADIAHAAYFHVRRYLLIQPGWMCRADITAPADLGLFRDERLKCLLGFECLLKPGLESYFPAEQLSDRMEKMRRALASLDRGASVAGYLFGVFDTAESWFFPTDASAPDSPRPCHWVPINCREQPNYPEWRQKWERLAAT